jgi:hypothetical protein
MAKVHPAISLPSVLSIQMNNRFTRWWYSRLQMRPRPLQILCLSPLLAIAITTAAQSASATGAASQGKTVTFDGAQTATLVLQAHGQGAQIYTCVKDADWAWKLKAPDATLFDHKGKIIGKHFAGPTWQLKDGSEVQGKALQVRQQPGTIPWLIVAVHSTGAQGRLSHVDIVRRTDTHGGAAPSTGCDVAHQGAEVRIPYSATYSFFDTKK